MTTVINHADIKISLLRIEMPTGTVNWVFAPSENPDAVKFLIPPDFSVKFDAHQDCNRLVNDLGEFVDLINDVPSGAPRVIDRLGVLGAVLNFV